MSSKCTTKPLSDHSLSNDDNESTLHTINTQLNVDSNDTFNQSIIEGVSNVFNKSKFKSGVG